MRGLRRLDGSWWIGLALPALLLALAIPTLGCGRFFLSQEVSRSPAVAAADGFGPAPSTATVWVEAVEPGFVRVVGKAFDDPDSAAAGAAPVQPLSPPIPMIDFGGESDPTEAVSALDVVRIDGGFFVAWQLRGSLLEGGETFGLFTDLALAPVGDPFVIFESSRPPAPAQGRNELWVYYVYYRHRVVVMTDDLRISYALIDSDTHALLDVSALPPEMRYPDVSYSDDLNRIPFMVTYLEAEDGPEVLFRVRAAFVDFVGEVLHIACLADVSATWSKAFNNTAGAPHPLGYRYVVWDERDGDVFGTFVRDDCVAGPETFLGTRSIEGSSGGQPSRRFFPMDVRFDDDGDGLVALKQAVPSDLVAGGVTYVVGVLPLAFDGLRITGGSLRPIGLPQRRGAPYGSRSFALRADSEAFKLVFDESRIDAAGLPVPSTWRALFDALDATGRTIDRR